MKSRIRPLIRFRRPQVGALPGTLTVSKEAPAPKISLIRYSHAKVDFFSDIGVEEVPGYVQPDSVVWIDVQGLGDERILKEIARQFDISDLALADIVNVPQRPKAEFLDEGLLVVTKMIRLINGYHLDREQVSIYLKGTAIITFQEKPGDVFDPIRRRLQASKGPLRKSDAPFLVYSLLDTVVDAYFPILEAMGEYIQQLEHYALVRPNQPLLQRASDVKNQLLNFSRTIWPQREVLKRLLDEDAGEIFNQNCRRHLRDTQDHTIQVSEINDMYREMASNLMHLTFR